ncbi:MAG: DUF3987 domain-containing protein [Desulfobacteraceae bacterium]|nr:MAG: DUF3987 domain-containing protein [Desulfobacteraceae bacterium]
MTSEQFFKTLYQNCEGGNVEFRYLPSGKQDFLPMERAVALQSFPSGQDSYFGVATRNGGGTKEHIIHIPGLWADLDFKQVPMEQAKENLKACPFPPSIVIDSGGGFHAYWIFREPAAKSDIPLIESYLRRLASYLQADMSGAEAARILRVPGTLNRKYFPARNVKILVCESSRQYELSDFDEWLPEDPKPATKNGERRNPVGWQDEALKGTGEGGRHLTALKLAGRWAAKGLSDAEIANFIVSWNASNNPPKESLCNPGSKEIQDIIAYVRGQQPANATIDPLAFPNYVIDGMAGLYADVYSSCLESPRHFFYMAFLTCLGSVVTGRLTLTSEIRPQPRLFTIILGESADDRKSTAINKTVDFFKDTLEEFKACFGVGSAEGLQKHLEGNRSLLLVFDELKQFVSKSKIDASILLPCVNTLFESNRYESRTKKSHINLENAHLSFLAASTIPTYERMWDASFTDIGFINRLFLVPGHGTRRFAIPPKVSDESREDLKRGLVQVLRHVGEHPELGLTPAATDLFQNWYMNLESSVHSKRLDVYAVRLMALLAANETEREISDKIVKKALALCDWQLEVRKQFAPIDADNAIARMEESIRRLLKRGPQTERELKRGTHADRTGVWMFQKGMENLQKAREIRLSKELKKWTLSL